jgi:carbon storage regulator
MLILQRGLHERIWIGPDITIEVVDIRGDKVRLGITCSKSIQVDREEIRRALERNRLTEGGM